MFKKTNMDKFNQAYLRIISECKRNSKKSVIRQGINEMNENSRTVFDDVIQPGKFYRLLGSWTYDGNGKFFSSMNGSITSTFLTVWDPTNENLQNYFNDLKNLIKSGFFESYDNKHNAELYIAGSFKNSNYDTKNSMAGSEFFDISFKEDYEQAKNALQQVSKSQFFTATKLALNIIQKEKQFLLNIQDVRDRVEFFNDDSQINPKI